jgi:hypothetical protein
VTKEGLCCFLCCCVVVSWHSCPSEANSIAIRNICIQVQRQAFHHIDKIKNAHTLSFFIFSNAGPLDPWSEENYEALQEKSGDEENGPVGPPVSSEEPHGSDELFETNLNSKIHSFLFDYL